MPLLDSFTVDHTIMAAPAVRVAKIMRTPHGDTITVFDLRFCRPNKEVMPERGIHTLEHLFAGFMRNHLNGGGGDYRYFANGMSYRFLHEPYWHTGRATCGKIMEGSDAGCS